MQLMFQSGREFAHAVQNARPGATIVYHTGSLANDAFDNSHVRDVARMARRLSDMSIPRSESDQSIDYGMGLGTMTQRRIGDGVYEYRFVKRRRQAR